MPNCCHGTDEEAPVSASWLIFLTLVEIVLLVAALAVYVVAITRRLRSVSKTLANVAFGVRAVESQLGAIGPALRRANAALGELDEAVPILAERAEQRAGS